MNDGYGGTWHNMSGAIKQIYHSLAGVNVTPKKALSLSVYYACIRNISEDIAKVPFLTYERQPNGDKSRAFDNPVYDILQGSANPDQDSMSVRELLTQWAVGWGNGLAEIQWSQSGQPAALWPIHPSRVRPQRDKSGLLVYEISNDNQQPTYIYPENMLHIKGLGGDGYWGYSVLKFAAESIGLGIAAQQFGSAFFGNGASVSGTLEHPGKLSDEAYKHLRESWSEKHAGVHNAHKPAILEEGMKWNTISVPPNEAQFLETRQFNVEDVCRWFRMPLHKVQHHIRAQGWSTLDAQNTDYVTDCLMTWMTRWESEVARKLFPGDRRHFSEHLIAGLLRGDMKSRAAFYRVMWGIGTMSINEIRRAENQNSVDGGDQYFVPMNMTTLDRAANGDQTDGIT